METEQLLRRARAARWIALAVLGAMALVAVIGMPLYVFPPRAEVASAEVPGAEVPGDEVPGAEVAGDEVPGAEVAGAEVASDAVAQADLIYIIGPPTATRIADAEALRERGVAQRVLVSVPASGSQSAAELIYCTRAYVSCRTPDPFTTRGEAAMLAAFAEPDAEVIVLTYTPHVTRTRFIFDTCADAEVRVLAVDERLSLPRWIYNYAYQSAAFVKAWIVGCAPPAG